MAAQSELESGKDWHGWGELSGWVGEWMGGWLELVDGSVLPTVSCNGFPCTPPIPSWSRGVWIGLDWIGLDEADQVSLRLPVEICV